MLQRREQAISQVKWELVPWTAAVRPEKHGDKGKVLEIGSLGKETTYPHFVGVDTREGAHYKVDALDKLADFETGGCDGVFAAYTLQCMADPVAALTEWCRVITVRGHLCLLVPKDFMEDDLCTVTSGELEVWMAAACPQGWDFVERMETPVGLFCVFRKRSDGMMNAEEWMRRATLAQLTKGKRVCIVRYGGFGDMIQSAYLFPEFKRQGWHVTMMTEPKGRSIIEHDPHVDEFIIQDNDQVPNHLLGPYWSYWAAKFDRFVNLSESVEGSLLAFPGRINHQWPQAVRHKYMNRNYGEWIAELAEIPFVPEGRFYPSEKEDADTLKFRRDLKGFTVMFAMAGSSFHKTYRWQDEVIGTLLELCQHVRIVTVGDKACQVLEQGFEGESRVVRMSGKLGIRETLALARQVDVVWGPETGVLNAVANEAMLKVVLLSHSSVENLTKHWTNTVALEPAGQHCYPCHQLHTTTRFCDVDPETVIARCQFKIGAERVLGPILDAYQAWERRYYKRPEPMKIAVASR